MESRRIRLVVAVVATAIAGCGDGSTGGPPAPTREVDILFMIDNSSGAADAQRALITNFPRFIQVLDGLPDGRPDLHIAVVSSDMGAGGGDINACNGDGNAGTFQYVARGLCTDTTLTPGSTYIVDGGPQTNHSGSLETVFSCIADLGIGGCGFESPLASIARALGADGEPPPENVGFLRPDAYLMIVVLTEEDDCSATLGPSSPIFDVVPNNLDAPLGPAQNFRCNEFGHVCDQGTPNRRAPNGLVTDTVTYTGCRSNEDSPYLRSVGSFVAAIRRLKRHPDERILVSSIVAVPQGAPNGAIPYQVTWIPAPLPDSGPWPFVAPGCGANVSGMLFGDPPVRLAEFTRHFGANGLLYSVCAQDYGPVMSILAERLADQLAR